MSTHPTVKTILVATDFSEDAAAALDWAAAVARSCVSADNMPVVPTAAQH